MYNNKKKMNKIIYPRHRNPSIYGSLTSLPGGKKFFFQSIPRMATKIIILYYKCLRFFIVFNNNIIDATCKVSKDTLYILTRKRKNAQYTLFDRDTYLSIR